jgi:regulator of CtrA degradation
MPGIVHTLHGCRTIAFAERIKNSSSFKTLFADGMKLVEEAAAYLDGPGRDEAKGFTTRLMQLASWLLLQRAVNEGEMSQAQAAADKHKVKVQRQELATAPEAFARLPERLRVLCERSLRLQSRILHLDAMIYASVQPAPATAPSVIETRFGDLRRALERL